jgi:competence ComEA-like helix-hairpin-helix protein
MFNLTTEERKVILFVSAVALCGVGVSFALKSRVPAAQFLNLDKAVKLDLNQVSLGELMRVLPQGLAKKIVEYRAVSGPFRALEDLLEIKGIGKSRYEKIKESFFVG